MDSEEKQKSFPEGKDVVDIAHLIIKAATSTIPIYGGPLAEIFHAVVTPSLERRREEWFRMVGNDLSDIKEKLRRLEREGGAEKFVTVFIRSTQIAVKTHQKEKLEALRSAVYNVANDIDIEEDLVTIFLGLIEDLTPSHIRILQYLDVDAAVIRYENPKKDNHAPYYFVTPENKHDAMARAVVSCVPELRNADFAKEVIKDLLSRNLIEDQPEEGLTPYSVTRMTGQGEGREILLSSLGTTFLEFIDREKNVVK